MKISIIIPVYNVLDHLKECLNSILLQHVDDLEVVLVDDGSTDGSGEFCDKWAKDKTFAIVVHQSNKGLSAARNTGLDHATGEIITFLDSDDRLGSDTLHDNLHYFSAYPNLDLLEYPVRIFEGSSQEHLLTFESQLVTTPYPDWLRRCGYNHCYVWNKLYRADLWKQVRFPIEEVFEDTAIMPSIIRSCHAIYYSSRGCYHYFYREGSISHRWHYTDSRSLFLNTYALYQESSSLSGMTRTHVSLHKDCLCRLIDMGRCQDCNQQDFAIQLSKFSFFDRLCIRAKLLLSSKLPG